MIKLKDILIEMSQEKANITNLAALDVEEVSDLQFKFNSKKVSPVPGVISHEIITIDVFNLEGKENIKFEPYHLIFGESSLSIFDTFGMDSIAGLSRSSVEKEITEKKAQGKTEKDGAVIGGLTNFAGTDLFQFFNTTRLSKSGMDYRIITHEGIHLARALITLEANEWLRSNLGKDKWWEDEKSAYTNMEDNNEEYFAEVLERVSAIAFDRWVKIK